MQPNMRNQSLRVYRKHLYRGVVCAGESEPKLGEESICVWEAWGAAIRDKLGEQGVSARERVVVQMEKWLQILKYIRDNGSQVSHGYRMKL